MKKKQAPLTATERKLLTALDAAQDVINWYEMDMDRSCYNDDDVGELAALERAYSSARSAALEGPRP